MNNLDPVAVAALLASIIFGPELAAIIGPYAVILLSSLVGAAWALGRRDTSVKLNACWFVLRLAATAMLVTVPLAALIGRLTWGGDASWMLAPIALIVGAVGDDWPRVGQWAFSCLGRVFERRAGGGK